LAIGAIETVIDPIQNPFMSLFMTNPAFSMVCANTVTQSFSVLYRLASMDLFHRHSSFQSLARLYFTTISGTHQIDRLLNFRYKVMLNKIIPVKVDQ
jgi:hypothetical protein